MGEKAKVAPSPAAETAARYAPPAVGKTASWLRELADDLDRMESDGSAMLGLCVIVRSITPSGDSVNVVVESMGAMDSHAAYGVLGSHLAVCAARIAAERGPGGEYSGK